MVHWFSVLSLIATFHLTTGVCQSTSSSTSNLLHVSALVGRDGASAFQCWAVEPPLIISQQPGTVGAKFFHLGNSTLSTVVFFNETNNIDAGLHNAPAPQWVFVLKGNGLVTLPTTNKTLFLPQGGFIIAADTADVSKIGHDTKWVAGSIAIQLPFTDGVVPDHTVIDPSGACPVPDHD